MLGRIILSILFIPINALLLWTVVSLIGERESYNKALLTAALFFIISLLSFISFSGFYASILGVGELQYSVFLYYGDFTDMISGHC